MPRTELRMRENNCCHKNHPCKKWTLITEERNLKTLEDLREPMSAHPCIRILLCQTLTLVMIQSKRDNETKKKQNVCTRNCWFSINFCPFVILQIFWPDFSNSFNIKKVCSDLFKFYDMNNSKCDSNSLVWVTKLNILSITDRLSLML